MASNIVKMVLKLDDKASPALKGVGREASASNVSMGKMALGAAAVGTALIAAGAAAVGATKAFIAMGQEYADQINLFNDMSVSTGISVGALEELNLMAKSTGVSLKTMERGLVGFQRNLGEAKVGTGTLTKALETLKLDPEQFTDTEDALKTVLEEISNVADASARAKLLNEAFGISAKDMAKVMQTQFGVAATALDNMDLRIGNATESAGEMQTALALQEIVLDSLKRKVFDTFLGGGGFVQGMSMVVGVAAGLVKMLEVVIEKVVDLAKGLTGTFRAIKLAAEGDFDAAGVAMEDSIKFAADFATGSIGETVDVIEIMTEAVEAGTEEYDKFAKSVALLSAEAEGQLVIAKALGDAERENLITKEEQKKAEQAAARAARARNLELQEQARVVAELDTAWGGLRSALDIFVGADFYGPIVDGTVAAVDATSQLAGEISKLIEPMGQVEQMLAGIKGVGHLDFGAQLAIEDIRVMYEDLSDIPLGFEAEVEHLRDMQIALAKSVMLAELLAQKGEGIPSGVREMITLLEQEIEGKTWELDAKVNAEAIPTLEANQLWIGELLADVAEVKQIRADKMEAVASAIDTASSTMTSLAVGDVAGAAQGLGAALGASPVFGAIVGGLGAIAEIGEMTAKEIRQNTIDFMDNLEKGFEVLVRALPSVIRLLLSRLPSILIDGLFALGEFLLSAELITAIAKGVWEGVQGLIPAIREIFSSDVESTEDMRTSGFGAIVDATRLLLNMKDQKEGGVESYASGSAKIGRTGLALLHRGEAVIPAGGRRAMTANGGGGGTVNINISTAIMDRDVIPRLVREIDRAVGKYGRTSAAFAGG